MVIKLILDSHNFEEGTYQPKVCLSELYYTCLQETKPTTSPKKFHFIYSHTLPICFGLVSSPSEGGTLYCSKKYSRCSSSRHRQRHLYHHEYHSLSNLIVKKTQMQYNSISHSELEYLAAPQSKGGIQVLHSTHNQNCLHEPNKGNA
jgi:hypothetical protein